MTTQKKEITISTYKKYVLTLPIQNKFAKMWFIVTKFGKQVKQTVEKKEFLPLTT